MLSRVMRDELGRCLLCALPSLDRAAAQEEPTIDQGRALLNRLRARARARARDRFEYFIKQHQPSHWPIPRHLRPVVDLWQRTATERVFAVIEMPPRHGKTVCAMSALAWHLYRDPRKVSAYATYEQMLSRTKSRAMRQIALDAGVELADDMANLDEWRTTAGGGVLATAVRGPLTGKGIDGVMVVDDSIKNREEANSDTIKEHIWEWFTDVVFSRLENQPGDRKASVVVMHTRWSEDDLIGRLLERTNHGICFERIRLPAIAEDDDPLGRQPGEPLWPERFSLAELEQIRSLQCSGYSWASLYQQSPAPLEGGLFKREWFKRRVERADLPKLDQVVMSLDANAKKTEAGSRAALVAIGAGRGPERYVLDAWAARPNLRELCNAVREMRARLIDAGLKPTKLLVEDKALGPAVIMELTEELRALNIPIAEVTPGDDKMSRAHAVVPVCEAGNVALIKGATWVDELVHELCVFPNGATDDFVDSFSQGITHLKMSRPPLRPYKL